MQKKTKINLVCKQCGEGFIRLACQLIIRIGGGTKGKFCSKKCMDESRKHGSIIECRKCNKKFYRRFGEQKRIVKQYCSKNCYFSDRELKQTTYIKEGKRHKHRIIIEKYLGRKLRDKEIIHHIDGNRHNNNLDNLCIVNAKRHAQIHFSKNTFDLTKYKIIS